jgi:hypothetical protein
VKLNRVRFTKDEAEWFSRNVANSLEILEAKAKADPKTLERTTYKVVKSMGALLQYERDSDSVDINLNKKQKLVLRGMCQSMAAGLRKNTIPAYEKDPEKYKEYLERATAKAALLESMARKLK